MTTIVIKNVPEDLHARLKDRAQRNRRSVTKELLTIIEQSVASPVHAPKLPRPIKLKGGPLTEAELRTARENGRE